MGAVTCCTRPLESTEEPAARISGPGGRTPTSRRAESGWPASAAAAARRVGSNAAACGARLVSRNYHRRTTASGPGPVGSNPVGLLVLVSRPSIVLGGPTRARRVGVREHPPCCRQVQAGPYSSDAGGTGRDATAARRRKQDATLRASKRRTVRPRRRSQATRDRRARAAGRKSRLECDPFFLSGLQRTTSPLGAGAALVFFLWGVVR